MLGVLSYVMVALALNLAIAHYRDVAQISSAQADVQAVQAMLSAPFGLRDLQSWLLLGMGAFFSVLACIDGFKFDDPYPGYGRKHRELVACQDDRDNLRTETLRATRVRSENTE